jgi:MFS family permease
MYCDRQAVFAMFKVLKADLAMTDTQLGWVAAIFLWVYGIGCPIAGEISRYLFEEAFGGSVACDLEHGDRPDRHVDFRLDAVGFKSGYGISEALYMPAAIALTANSTPNHQRSRAIAILTTAQSPEP